MRVEEVDYACIICIYGSGGKFRGGCRVMGERAALGKREAPEGDSDFHRMI